MMKNDLIVQQQQVTKLRAEGKYKETIEKCYELIEKGMEFSDYKSILTAYVNLVAAYYCIGAIEEAFNYLSSYSEICEEYGDDLDRLNLYNSMVLLYEYNKDIEKAKDSLEKSITLGKSLKKYNIVSNGYSNYSHICYMNKEYNEALEMALCGLSAARKHEPASAVLEVRVKLNIAKAYIALEDFDSSKALIDEIINDKTLDSFIREKTQCYDLQGKWYSEQKLYSEAFQSYTYAKTLAESYNDVTLLRPIQEERCKLCDLLGDISLGYKVQKEFIALLNEINERELALTALKLEIKHSIALMEKRANLDYLTGVYNRNYIETTTNKWLKTSNKLNESIVCIVFDVDKFKAINDEYGHLFGDEVIKEVSRVCSKIIRESDLIGRFGGDEFVVILKGASIEDGKKKAEQILEEVRNLDMYNNGKHIPITLSIGVSNNLECPAKFFNELFNSADIRLYNAKNSGRNQICATF